MRITNSMLVAQLLWDLTASNKRMGAIQRELSSGKRINTPSDDPTGVVRAARLGTQLNETYQYQKTTDEATSWLELTDVSLGEAGHILQRARELAVRSGSSTLPKGSLLATAKEVDQLIDEMVQVANASYGDRHIFSGQKTLTTPFVLTRTADPTVPGGEVVGFNYQGDAGALTREMGNGFTVSINTPGAGALQESIQALIDLRNHLYGGDTASISGPDLTQIDTGLDHLLAERVEAGARLTRVETAKNRLDDSVVSLSQVLSKTQDADTARTIMELKTEEYARQASLAAGARILQPTLLDFLR
ncbi:MAG: flagellar hook-associated protein FlgL [Firmicutes bacterium]|nr:flagellar hook-associated protein FlgL [Bacillota bacterium]MCL5040455.1 flagellar hook-associated protein FlgL [Bacillota bacterium]